MTIRLLRNFTRPSTIYKRLLCILIMLCPAAFSIAQSYVGDSSKVSFASKSSLDRDSLLHYAKSYLGVPYKIAGRSAKGFDCSGFVHHVYKKFDVVVPYSCPGISNVCTTKLKKEEVQKGDLLFFKGSNAKSKAIGHIAIVHHVDEAGIHMIHSCRRGVILETLESSSYYKARYLFAKRIL